MDAADQRSAGMRQDRTVAEVVREVLDKGGDTERAKEIGYSFLRNQGIERNLAYACVMLALVMVDVREVG